VELIIQNAIHVACVGKVWTHGAWPSIKEKYFARDVIAEILGHMGLGLALEPAFCKLPDFTFYL